jgi:hypothetical protein
MIKLENQDFTNNYLVPERKVNNSLLRRGEGQGGGNNISGLSFPSHWEGRVCLGTT